jgi:hypothetical protein
MSPASDQFEQGAAEKRASRDDDAAALASGLKSPEQLRAENGHFAARRARIRLDLAESLD